MQRTGETRVLLLVALFGLLGVPPAIGLWTHWEHPLTFDLAGAAGLALFGAAALGLASVAMLRRTLLDLDRAEGLHWNSMESVRHLSELAALRASTLDERLPKLLQVGCERLGLEIGYVSRVGDGRYEILAVHAPADCELAAGARFALDESPCAPTLASRRAVASVRADEADPSEPATHPTLAFDTYLGAAVWNGDAPVGTLVFAGRGPRREPLNATHKDLVQLMAQWIGWELERGTLRESVAEAPQKRAARPARRGASPAGLDIGALLRRARRRLRPSLPDGVDVKLAALAGLPQIPMPGVPVEAILLSLARRAAAALPDGGVLELGAEAQQPAARGSAAGPAGFVALFVSESSGGVDPDALAKPDDPTTPDAGDWTAGHDAGIPLVTIQRMLKRVGGDLSVEVEPGRRSHFTVYLPLDASAAPHPRAAAAPPPGDATVAPGV